MASLPAVLVSQDFNSCRGCITIFLENSNGALETLLPFSGFVGTVLPVRTVPYFLITMRSSTGGTVQHHSCVSRSVRYRRSTYYRTVRRTVPARTVLYRIQEDSTVRILPVRYVRTVPRYVPSLVERTFTYCIPSRLFKTSLCTCHESCASPHTDKLTSCRK